MKPTSIICGAAAFFAALLPLTSFAQLRSFSGYNTFSLGHIDDDPSAGPIALGFNANFFGATYSQLWVNNNGSVTFDGAFDDAFTSFIPGTLASLSRAILAPFFADVDTTALDSGVATYGKGTLGGHNAFAANWINVEPYFQLPVYNTFQVVLIDRSDTGAGNFDVEFNYGSIAWEGGEATGSNELGLGGLAAYAGISDGTLAHTIQLAGSGVNGAFEDTNRITGLLSSPAGVDFAFRGGALAPPVSAVPEPSTYGMIAGAALLTLAVTRRRRTRKANAFLVAASE